MLDVLWVKVEFYNRYSYVPEGLSCLTVFPCFLCVLLMIIWEYEVNEAKIKTKFVIKNLMSAENCQG